VGWGGGGGGGGGCAVNGEKKVKKNLISLLRCGPSQYTKKHPKKTKKNKKQPKKGSLSSKKNFPLLSQAPGYQKFRNATYGGN